eukprot:TRINITY_DN7866_c0_g1_i1.p2 TRINITY_DN7866_c0_g1~~TRINITY_DN7866_c0_g1_i1.p2  ORF type:complete len:152 (-),score=40.38 TRINITY_DN7866_c0_g1_i1:108-563(-)
MQQSEVLSCVPFLSECSHINDVVDCILHVLQNDKIEGFSYAIKGKKAMTFDSILDLIANHCGQLNYKKFSYGYIGTTIEKFFIGRTHDKNFMKLLQWHEIEPQNYMNNWNYLEKFNIAENYNIKDTYPESKANLDWYVRPYLYQYKHIVLD